MSTYLYRCQQCGQLVEHEQSMQDEVHEELTQRAHQTGRPVSLDDPLMGPWAKVGWEMLCFGTLKRVYTPPHTNLGFREAIHTPDDRFRFAHLDDRPSVNSAL